MTVILVLLVILALVVAGLVFFSASTARKVEAALPPPGRFIDVDGCRLHYVDTGGDKPPLVMIHGLGGTLFNYRYALIDRLAADYRVIAVDRPGSGYSERPADASATLGAQARTLATFIRALKLDKPLLVGHSLGGALSLAIALGHPDCAGALALIAPLTHAQDEVPEPFRGLVVPSPLVRRIIAATLAVPLSIRRAQATLAVVFGPDAAPADYATRGGGLLGLRPKSFYNTSSDLIAVNTDLPAMMARYATALTLPMAMLYAKGDRILDYRAQGEAMKRTCPALDLTVLDAHGHMLPITAPERCEALIRSVAARMPASRAVA
ncbi:alpha/beta fold hydrolase [Bradyrhizobium sp. 2TAF24]|uniref:alpha/beta fold hydrolase n=1 Tax=Bradyrhizobium sp. 2TAF24 TaxID=3233011 RepID=UPI003F8DD933